MVGWACQACYHTKNGTVSLILVVRGETQHPVHDNWGDIFFDLFYVALACKLCVCMWQEAGAVKLPESIHLVVAHQVDLLFQTIWEICYEKIRPGKDCSIFVLVFFLPLSCGI